MHHSIAKSRAARRKLTALVEAAVKSCHSSPLLVMCCLLWGGCYCISSPLSRTAPHHTDFAPQCGKEDVKCCFFPSSALRQCVSTTFCCVISVETALRARFSRKFRFLSHSLYCASLSFEFATRRNLPLEFLFSASDSFSLLRFFPFELKNNFFLAFLEGGWMMVRR